MKKSLSLIFIVLVIAACNKSGNKQSAKESAGTPIPVLVDELLKNPDPYIEKAVSIEGLVTHVCRHSGARLHLKAGGSNEFVRVEAKGDIGQFDRELEGDNLLITGVFHKQIIDKEFLAKWENELSAGSHTPVESHVHSGSEGDMELLAEIKYELENSGKDQITQVWVDGESFSVKSAN